MKRYERQRWIKVLHEAIDILSIAEKTEKNQIILKVLSDRLFILEQEEVLYVK